MKSLAILIAAWLSASAVAAQDARLATPGGARDYDFVDQTVYPLVATPGRITDIVLEPGETLTGPIAAGDTARWIIADSASGSGSTRRIHVLVKPTVAPLATNLLIMSDRRTYHLELRASARTWFSEIAWRYPPVEPSPVPIPAEPIAPAEITIPDPEGSIFAYRLEGDQVAWRPARVFDNGRRTYIVFAPSADLTALPPLYQVGEDGKASELIDYHVFGRTLIVDRLVDRVELRLGLGRRAKAVRIIRTAKEATR
ncbi:TrbG/VirB9 family P-type conjugative transfer protein [Caulobacter sp. UNC279MFTsu5.1]|uniref:TrbG/VirB9 family P-type conjugative transfer protein n=1 Tax=Caulobacter sp. UNC279MFTsu5.1 TaxID=1502775 RepID=UPI00039EF674|nr:TrbG/VirB9 family P-type conjugative transfer protein [Caulobacter sp. UNC279MFTsu5.1]SFI56428.1 type IV secretion system protein VirB9 [Caulobacter sp. UNC279MFTsu5.1]